MATLVSKTVQASGGNYTSLTAFEAGEQRDLVVADEIAEADCDKIAEDEGTSFLTFDAAWTTDATRYIRCKARQSHGSTGQITTNAYRLLADEVVMQTKDAIHLHLEGIQLHQRAISANNSCIRSFDNSFAGYLRLDKCVLVNDSASSVDGNIQYGGDVSCDLDIINSIIVHTVNGGGRRGVVHRIPGQVNIYSSIIISGANDGLQIDGADSASAVFKNVYAHNKDGVGTAFDVAGAATFVTCASSDGSGTSATVAYSTATFAGVTAGAEDFTPVNGGGVHDAGTDTSGDAAPFNFSDDIVGTVRPEGAGWDIGAVELVEAGTPVTATFAGSGESLALVDVKTAGAQESSGVVTVAHAGSQEALASVSQAHAGAQESLASALAALAGAQESLEALTALTAGAEESLSGVTSTFDGTQESEAPPISMTGTFSHESLQEVTSTSSGAHEALAEATAPQAGAEESLVGLTAATSGAQESVAAVVTSLHAGGQESLAAIAATIPGAEESLTQITVLTAGTQESDGLLLSSHSGAQENISFQTLTVDGTGESLLAIQSAANGGQENLIGLTEAAPGAQESSSFEALAVGGTGESLTSAQGTSSGAQESLFGASLAVGGTQESLGQTPVTAVYGGTAESLAAPTLALSGTQESVVAVEQAYAGSQESLGFVQQAVSGAHESTADLILTYPGSQESGRGVTSLISGAQESQLGLVVLISGAGESLGVILVVDLHYDFVFDETIGMDFEF